MRNHANEEEVKCLNALQKEVKKRDKGTECENKGTEDEKKAKTKEIGRMKNMLRNQGDHLHNLRVLKGEKGELLVSR